MAPAGRRPDHPFVQQYPAWTAELLPVRGQLRVTESHPVHLTLLPGENAGAQVSLHHERDLPATRIQPTVRVATPRWHTEIRGVRGKLRLDREDECIRDVPARSRSVGMACSPAHAVKVRIPVPHLRRRSRCGNAPRPPHPQDGLAKATGLSGRNESAKSQADPRLQRMSPENPPGRIRWHPIARSGLRLHRTSCIAWDRRAGCLETGPVRFGRGRLDSLRQKGLAAYLITPLSLARVFSLRGRNCKRINQKDLRELATRNRS